jgi:ribonuclease BN (tRNA processing enzyme)
MKITVLGSGTAAPRLIRNMSGYLVEIGSKKLLFDSGPGTIRQLLKLGTSLLDIDYLFYTHFHNDHISDLPAIIWSNNYGTYRKKPLYVCGPEGFSEYFNVLMTKILRPGKLSYKIRVRELKENSTLKISLKTEKCTMRGRGGFAKIRAMRVKHAEPSIGYRIEHKGKSLVYSGDTTYCKGLISLAKKCDVLILECAFPTFKPEHLTPAMCGRVAAEANAKRLVLTHFYPECDKVNVIKQCRNEFKGKVIKARDFLAIEI